MFGRARQYWDGLRQRVQKLSGEPYRQPIYRRFDGAGGGRRHGGAGSFGPINAEVGAAGHTLASRAAHLAENNPLIANAVGNFVSEIVGTGIRPTPAHSDSEIRKLLLSGLDRWSDVADADERTDFYGLQAAIVRDVIVKGEAFLLLIETEEGLRLRHIDPEQVDRNTTRPLNNGAGIVQGVEFDADGRRVAYWISPHRQIDTFGSWAPPVRVDALDVLHVFRSHAAGQVRGISWLAPIILSANEFDKLTDALLMGASVAAMFAGFITDENNMGEGEDPFGGEDQPSLEPGTLVRLRGGQRVVFSTPQQAQQTNEFVKTQIRALAAGLGIPSFLMDGDLTGANYSSLRAGLLPFRRRNEQFQYGTLVPQLLRPIWRRFIAHEILFNGLDVDFEEACRGEWIMPKPLQVDPQKDVEADIAEIGAGLASRRQKVAERGWSVEDLDAEIATDPRAAAPKKKEGER